MGRARLTPGFRLPAKWVIHTVGPVWKGGGAGEREALLSCYRSSLELAQSLGCESIAFPLISSGAYGYPKDKAMETAREAIEAFLWQADMNVYLVLYGDETTAISHRYWDEIREYIDSAYVAAHPYRRNARRVEEDYLAAQPAPDASEAWATGDSAIGERRDYAVHAPEPSCMPRPAAGAFDRRFGRLDESFQQMLLRLIDRRGISDAACYKRANIDRKLFSKIRKDAQYKPSKPTALAFAVALELSVEETEELLEKAGFALSRSSRFDLIVRWFIEHGIYDVLTINETLFEFDQNLLGNVT